MLPNKECLNGNIILGLDLGASLHRDSFVFPLSIFNTIHTVLRLCIPARILCLCVKGQLGAGCNFKAAGYILLPIVDRECPLLCRGGNHGNLNHFGQFRSDLEIVLHSDFRADGPGNFFVSYGIAFKLIRRNRPNLDRDSGAFFNLHGLLFHEIHAVTNVDQDLCGAIRLHCIGDGA